MNGHRVASYVSDRLGQELLALIGAPSSREEAAAATSALREAHHRTERALEASAVDCTAAGCTGVCIVLLRPSPSQGPNGEDVTGGSGGTRQGAASRPENAAVTMLVSNVGDSRAVLGSSVPRSGQFGAAQLESSGLDPRDSRALAKPTHSPSTVSAKPANGKAPACMRASTAGPLACASGRARGCAHRYVLPCSSLLYVLATMRPPLVRAVRARLIPFPPPPQPPSTRRRGRRT